jgi:hypothetical protein
MRWSCFHSELLIATLRLTFSYLNQIPSAYNRNEVLNVTIACLQVRYIIIVSYKFMHCTSFSHRTGSIFYQRMLQRVELDSPMAITQGNLLQMYGQQFCSISTAHVWQLTVYFSPQIVSRHLVFPSGRLNFPVYQGVYFLPRISISNVWTGICEC